MPLGSLTLAALGVCVASGIVVMTGFEPSEPLWSTLAFELERPFGWFFRALHAWSAQLFLLCLLAHTAEYVVRRTERETAPTTWAVLTLSLPVAFYLMVSGRALPADAEARGVAAVLSGLLGTLPGVGPAAADVLVGHPDRPHVLLSHHAATGTLVLLAITVFHVRKVFADAVSTVLALGMAGVVSLVVRPELVGEAGSAGLRGPWFLGGLRVLLRWVPAWLAGVAMPLALLAVLACLPALGPRAARLAKLALGAACVLYAGLTVMSVWT